MADLAERQCHDTDPHPAHHWLYAGGFKAECPGLAGKGSRTKGTKATEQVISNTVAEGWVDVFYVDSWIDPQAVNDPRLSARRRATNGPFPTYLDAQDYPPKHRPATTHFSVRKVTARVELVQWFTPDVLQYATEILG